MSTLGNTAWQPGWCQNEWTMELLRMTQASPMRRSTRSGAARAILVVPQARPTGHQNEWTTEPLRVIPASPMRWTRDRAANAVLVPQAQQWAAEGMAMHQYPGMGFGGVGRHRVCP